MSVIIFLISLVLIFVGYLVFTWTADVTNDPRFSKYLGQAIVVKASSQIVWCGDKNLYRFREYQLRGHDNTRNNSSVIKTMKFYSPLDTIVFVEAKSYYSLFTGTTYYLIGSTTLDDGRKIEFEYYYQPTSLALWETLDEYVGRRDKETQTH